MRIVKTRFLHFVYLILDFNPMTFNLNNNNCVEQGTRLIISNSDFEIKIVASQKARVKRISLKVLLF